MSAMKFIDDLKADFGVRHFAAAKFQRDLHLHVLAQKIDRVRQLDAQVVRVNARAQLDFLDDGGVLVLLGFLFLLGHFVAEFAEIHQPADRRHGGRGDFDQIHAMLARQIDRVGERQDAELVAVHSDDADFAGADFAVDPDERSRRGIAWRERAAQDTLVGCDMTLIFSIKLTATTGNS